MIVWAATRPVSVLLRGFSVLSKDTGSFGVTENEIAYPGFEDDCSTELSYRIYLSFLYN